MKLNNRKVFAVILILLISSTVIGVEQSKNTTPVCEVTKVATNHGGIYRATVEAQGDHYATFNSRDELVTGIATAMVEGFCRYNPEVPPFYPSWHRENHELSSRITEAMIFGEVVEVFTLGYPYHLNDRIVNRDTVYMSTLHLDDEGKLIKWLRGSPYNGEYTWPQATTAQTEIARKNSMKYFKQFH